MENHCQGLKKIKGVRKIIVVRNSPLGPQTYNAVLRPTGSSKDGQVQSGLCLGPPLYLPIRFERKAGHEFSFLMQLWRDYFPIKTSEYVKSIEDSILMVITQRAHADCAQMVPISSFDIFSTTESTSHLLKTEL